MIFSVKIQLFQREKFSSCFSPCDPRILSDASLLPAYYLSDQHISQTTVLLKSHRALQMRNVFSLMILNFPRSLGVVTAPWSIQNQTGSKHDSDFNHLTSASFPEKAGCGFEIIQEAASVLLGPILNLGCFSFLILLLYFMLRKIYVLWEKTRSFKRWAVGSIKHTLLISDHSLSNLQNFTIYKNRNSFWNFLNALKLTWSRNKKTFSRNRRIRTALCVEYFLTVSLCEWCLFI